LNTWDENIAFFANVLTFQFYKWTKW